MKFIKACFLFSFMAAVLPTAWAVPEVSVTCVDEKPSEVLQMYVSLSHKKVNVSREIMDVRTPINVTIKGKPQDRAAKIIEQALRTQAHIELIPETDGTLTARIIAPGS